MATILLLMPKYYNICKDKDPHFLEPGMTPRISCIRCKSMACPNCYKPEDINLKNSHYVCDPCIEKITNEVGFNVIDDKYLKKKYEPKHF